jgi:hypothetical protein
MIFAPLPEFRQHASKRGLSRYELRSADFGGAMRSAKVLAETESAILVTGIVQ